MIISGIASKDTVSIKKQISDINQLKRRFYIEEDLFFSLPQSIQDACTNKETFPDDLDGRGFIVKTTSRNTFKTNDSGEQVSIIDEYVNECLEKYFADVTAWWISKYGSEEAPPPPSSAASSSEAPPPPPSGRKRKQKTSKTRKHTNKRRRNKRKTRR